MTGGGYRPDSVPRGAASIHLGRASPRGSSSLPGDLTHRSGMRGQAPLASLFGLAPHGVYRALSVSGEAVRSYRTLSPLPSTDSRAVCSLRHFPSRCRGRGLPGMPPVAESGPSSRAHAPADARLLQPRQGYHQLGLNRERRRRDRYLAWGASPRTGIPKMNEPRSGDRQTRLSPVPGSTVLCTRSPGAHAPGYGSIAASRLEIHIILNTARKNRYGEPVRLRGISIVGRRR